MLNGVKEVKEVKDLAKSFLCPVTALSLFIGCWLAILYAAAKGVNELGGVNQNETPKILVVDRCSCGECRCDACCCHGEGRDPSSASTGSEGVKEVAEPRPAAKERASCRDH